MQMIPKVVVPNVVPKCMDMVQSKKVARIRQEGRKRRLAEMTISE